jgi:hypothetical protein
MQKYHPNAVLRVIGKEWFATNGKILKKVIKDW